MEVNSEVGVWMEVELQSEKGMSGLIDSLELIEPPSTWMKLRLQGRRSPFRKG